MKDSENPDNKKSGERHQQKMEIYRFWAGIGFMMGLGYIEVFVKPVPIYLYGFTAVVLGIDIQHIVSMFTRK